MALLRMRDFLTLAVRPSVGRGLIMQDAADGDGAGIVVRVAAVHSARVNGNFRFYRPDYMASDYRSFAPKGRPARPVLWNHDSDEKPIGRVLSARYIDESDRLLARYPQLADSDLFGRRMRDGARRMSALDAARFIYSKIQKADESYSGAGYIELEARISEPDAAARLRRGELLTVSVGFVTDAAVCSVCGTDWAEEGRCEHVPGEVYDGQLAFLVAGRQEFQELSFVNAPADPFAAVVAEADQGALADAAAAMVAGMRPFGGLWMSDGCGCGGDWLEELPEPDRAYFLHPESHYEDLWREVQAGLADGSISPDWLAFGGDGRLTAAQRKKLRPSQFCGPNRTFPVPDCAHVTAALRLLGRAKVSEATRARIRACVLRKARSLGCRTEAARDDAWRQLLVWMLSDIRPVRTDALEREGTMLTVDEMANSELDSKALLEAIAQARASGQDEAAAVMDAAVARLADSGWFRSEDGWTEAEVRLQIESADEIAARLPEADREAWRARLAAEAQAYGLELPETSSGQDASKADASQEAAAGDSSPMSRLVGLVEEIERLVEGLSEEEAEKAARLLLALAEKVMRESFLQYLKSELADRGMALVPAADADAAERLRKMVAELKEANRRMLADRKRDLATQVVLLMALTGEAGFDVKDSAALEAEIERRAARQLVSLQDSLEDLRARFFQKKDFSQAGPSSGEAVSAEASPAAIPGSADPGPGMIYVTDADLRAIITRQAVEIYRRLKGQEE